MNRFHASALIVGGVLLALTACDDEPTLPSIKEIAVTVPPYCVDQANDYAYLVLHNLTYYSPVGQEFVPTFDTIEFVELRLKNYGELPGEFYVEVHQDYFDGPVVGTSETVVLPAKFDGVARFTFNAVALTPLYPYVMAIVSDTDGSWLIGDSSDFYDAGRMIMRGGPTDLDMWFREGTETPCP